MYPIKFINALQVVSILEGGYQDNEADRGNYVGSDGSWAKGKATSGYYGEDGVKLHLIGTNHGVSAPALYKYLQRLPTRKEMQDLSKEAARDIFYKFYWQQHRVEKIENQDLATFLFDAIINQGGVTSVKLLQQAINDRGGELEVDGRLGAMSAHAANTMPLWVVWNAFRNRRLMRYEGTLASDPAQAVFGGGWDNRLKAFPAMSLPEEQLALADPVASSFTPSSPGTVAIMSGQVLDLMQDADASVNEFLVRFTPLENKPGRDNLKIIQQVTILALVLAIVAFLVSKK